MLLPILDLKWEADVWTLRIDFRREKRGENNLDTYLNKAINV